MSLYGGGLGQHNKERNGSLRTKDNHREIPFKQQRIAVWEGEKEGKMDIHKFVAVYWQSVSFEDTVYYTT